METSNQESTSVWKMALCANIVSLFHIPFHDSNQRGYLISSLETHWRHHHFPGSHSSCFAWGRGDFMGMGSTSPDAIMLQGGPGGQATKQPPCFKLIWHTKILHAIEHVRDISVTDRASCEVGFSLAFLGFLCPSPPVSPGTILGVMMSLHRPLCLDTWSPVGGDVLEGCGTFRRWDFSRKERVMGV